MRIGANIWTAAAIAAALWMSPAPTSAQMPVIDPANLVQSVMQAARALEQIHNQVQQIEQQARMLQRGELQMSPQFVQSLRETRALFERAEGIAFELAKVSSDIEALYPETWENHGLDEIAARSAQWLAADRAILERTLRAHAQAVEAMDARRGQLERALAASAGAEGQTSAVQAGNQLLGVQATQLGEIQAQLVMEGRALATERLERVAQAERARDIQRRAFPAQSAQAPPAARSPFRP